MDINEYQYQSITFLLDLKAKNVVLFSPDGGKHNNTLVDPLPFT